jgi:hypothetical protein
LFFHPIDKHFEFQIISHPRFQPLDYTAYGTVFFHPKDFPYFFEPITTQFAHQIDCYQAPGYAILTG